MSTALTPPTATLLLTLAASGAASSAAKIPDLRYQVGLAGHLLQLVGVQRPGALLVPPLLQLLHLRRASDKISSINDGEFTCAASAGSMKRLS